MGATPKYRRVLLKVSGEALMGSESFGIDVATVERIAADVKDAVEAGTQVCLVIGGGNIFRGLAGAAKGIDRSTADYMGMLATVMNALAMQAALERAGIPTRVQSAIPMTTVCEPYIRRRAIRHMEKGRVVIFAAGTGNPFFTTDTAAALRAAEMNCEAMLKGTQVDGVYTADPKKDPQAQRFDSLSYHEVLTRDLQVMDASHSQRHQHEATVESLLEAMGLAGTPRLLVWNKIDVLDQEERSRLSKGPMRVEVSALTGEGFQTLEDAIDRALEEDPIVETEFEFSAGDGERLALLHRAGNVLSTCYEDNRVRVRARMAKSLWKRLESENDSAAGLRIHP